MIEERPVPRLNSVADLDKLRDEILSKRDPHKPCIALCAGTGCIPLGAKRVAAAFKEEIKNQGLEDKLELKETGCPGFCEKGPIVSIYPEGICYCGVKPEDVAEIASQTAQGKIVDRLLYIDPVTGEKAIHEQDIPFYKHQMRLLLGNNTRIDPQNICDSITLGGYSALAKVLAQMTPEQVIGEVEKSQLKGRGGAGFPTGRKWRIARNSPGDMKYVIVNCDEGDPGAYMDRSLMEGNPHAILEGLIIGAYAMGARAGIIYVREEYPLAVENAEIALRQAEEYGLLGKDILRSGFDFHAKVIRGGGAFVCGEETALIASLEGKPGEPRQRPPFPAASGLWGMPTNINNVETWANIPLIIRNGAEWFNAIGTADSKGTKIFSLVGKVNNTGLVEVPMGISLRDIIYKIGGGISSGKQFKAVQTGGPSGGCIPAAFLDTPVDYDELAKLGSIMGSGGMIVMDEDTCMVDLAKYFLGFLADESCGKCLSCREGIRQMQAILNDITEGRGQKGDIELLERLAIAVKKTSLCALGQTSPNSVLTTLRHFRDEYVEHIDKKRCRALVCKKLVIANCRHTCPAGVNVPRYIRFIAKGMYDDALAVIRENIPFPAVCGRVCIHPCETKCRRNELDEPIAIMALKRFASDKGNNEHWMSKLKMPPQTGKKVAIVGSGPAGLTAAYYLSRLGHAVTIFEALSRPGGMMLAGIPEYRLPKLVLDKEIDVIRELGGVKIELNRRIESLHELSEQGFNATFLALGAHLGTKLGIEGENLPGVVDCISLLRQINLDKQDVKLGNRVAIVGGGNAAVDAARTALRLGSKEVTIIYRRSRAEMPAYREEVEEAESEGVKLQFLVAPLKIKQNGSMLEIECTRMKLGAPDETGRPRFEPIAGTEFTQDFETVVAAIGQTADIPEAMGIDTTKNNRIQADPDTLATGKEGVFAGGDAVSGPASIIEAIAAGRRAAASIDKYLGGSGMIGELLASPEDLALLPEIKEEERHRSPMPLLPLSERLVSFNEGALGYDEKAAIEEALHCLMCDLEEGD